MTKPMQTVELETLVTVTGGAGSNWYQRYLDGAKYADEVVAPRTGIHPSSREAATNRRVWGVSNALFPKYVEADRASAARTRR